LVSELLVSDFEMTEGQEQIMIDSLTIRSVVHILDSNAMQRALIAKALSAETIETKCHNSWEGLKNHCSPTGSSCLVLEYNYFIEAQRREYNGSPSTCGLLLTECGLPIPFVFIADRPTISDVVRGMRFGATDFLEKPICNYALIKAVQTGIQKRSQLRKQGLQSASVKALADQLTNRERETMTLVLEGMSIKQIASQFGIGLQTAAKHRARLLSKMNVRSDAQLVQLIYSNNLTPVS
jgi:FixJ family two-component response regulator